MPAPISETVYDYLTNDEDARACRDISEDACVEVPGNFLRLLSTHVLTKLADAIANPKTVLAWLATSLGAPPGVIGLLVPIRESGSMIPQIVIGGWVRRLPVRKWIWVLGSALQACSVAGIAFVAARLEGVAAGWALLGLVSAFSLARGLCSVASKDVLGKTIPKGRRGQLTGWSASAAGLITVGLGLLLFLPGQGETRPALLSAALFGGAGLWLVAAFVYARVNEAPGATEGGASALRQAWANLGLLARDAPFRRFVIARALLMCSALSAPYYVALAQERIGSKGVLLGSFVVAGGLANLVSAPVWGRFADASSRRVMAVAGALAAGMGLLLTGIEWAAPAFIQSAWLVPLAYFVLSVAHSGVRVGRKTYVVDLASGNRRTDYVSVGNCVIGVLLLGIGTLGAAASSLGSASMIAALGVMGATGALLSSRLKET